MARLAGSCSCSDHDAAGPLGAIFPLPAAAGLVADDAMLEVWLVARDSGSAHAAYRRVTVQKLGKPC